MPSRRFPLLTALVLLLSSPARVHAVYEPTLPPDAHPGASCGIFRVEGGKEAAHCSGTLVAPDRVLTAGHCVPPGEERSLALVARCGTQGLSSAPIRLVAWESPPGAYDESGSWFLPLEYRLGLLESPSREAPLPLATSGESEAIQASPAPVCLASGWGRNNRGDGLPAVGIPLSSSVGPDELSWDTLGLALSPSRRASGAPSQVTIAVLKRTGGLVMGPGDSGGTLSCKGADGIFRLVATLQDGSLSGRHRENKLTATASLRDWILSKERFSGSLNNR